MNLLNMLALAADEEQLRLHPLPEHAAASQGKHLCQHYAMLLASVLTAQSAVSETQTRLLRLLLDALKLGDIRALLFEQARELSPHLLIEAASLVREAGFAQHLVLDALVLLRLDAPLNEEVTRLAGELASFLGLDEGQLATRAKDAAEILGLNAIPHEESPTSATKTWNGEVEAPSATAERQPSLADFWPAQLSQPLTAEALQKGLNGGVWVLESDLVVHEPWQAEDAVLFFRNGATLTSLTNNNIYLSGCRLFVPVMICPGAGEVKLDRCEIWGNYNPADKRTALKLNMGKLTVMNSRFSTRNAQTIAVQDGSFTVQGSSFTCCGHVELDGGALWCSCTFLVVNCHFESCRAARGGAIWTTLLSRTVEDCEFIACESVALKDGMTGNIAIYAKRNTCNPVLNKCVFRHTSVNIGSSFDGYGRTIVDRCLFVNANLYCYNAHNHNFRFKSEYNDGNVIYIEI